MTDAEILEWLERRMFRMTIRDYGGGGPCVVMGYSPSCQGLGGSIRECVEMAVKNDPELMKVEADRLGVPVEVCMEKYHVR